MTSTKGVGLMDRDEFESFWSQTGEDQSPHVVATAWQRYSQIGRQTPQYDDPTIDDLQSVYDPVFDKLHDLIQEVKYIYVDGRRPPWTPAHLELTKGQEVSIFATGRIWRSRVLDLWLAPQFGLWGRFGVNGNIFNSVSNTNTVRAECDGDLYLATQFPGQFSDRSGRVQTDLGVYEAKGDGGYSVIVIVWNTDAAISSSTSALRKMVEVGDDRFGLLSGELNRQDEQAARPVPSSMEDWQFLAFMAISDHFTLEKSADGVTSICCRPNGKAGILQRDLVVPLTSKTVLEWDWIISALPSRLREDTTFTHDYLSVALEFENGRDLTYTWSWELPAGFGYWCPLATWKDREYHIVVRSGTELLGSWLPEKRNVFEDYERYVGISPTPEVIVRVWLIAGSRWQRVAGEMVVKNLRFSRSENVVEVL